MGLDFIQPTLNAVFTGLGVAIGQHIYSIWKKYLFVGGKKHFKKLKK